MSKVEILSNFWPAESNTETAMGKLSEARAAIRPIVLAMRGHAFSLGWRTLASSLILSGSPHLMLIFDRAKTMKEI